MQSKQNILQKYPVIKHLGWMLLISLALLTLVFLFIRIYSRHGKTYELPDMSMQPLSQMERGNNLDLKFIILDSLYKEGMEGGLILTQNPKAGSVIKKGRKIYVTVTAAMPDDAILPDITGGVTLRNAIAQLEGVGLKGGKLVFKDSPFRNTILEMSYNGEVVYAGQKLHNGAKVDLVVGIGDDPTKAYSIVPFVIGKQADRVRHEILSASFNIGMENYDGVTNRATAVVYRQEPGYDGLSRLPFGSRVNLWYCDADEQKINKMITDYKIDSSAIVNPQDERPEWGVPDDTPFEDEGLSW